MVENWRAARVSGLLARLRLRLRLRLRRGGSIDAVAELSRALSEVLEEPRASACLRKDLG